MPPCAGPPLLAATPPSSSAPSSSVVSQLGQWCSPSGQRSNWCCEHGCHITAVHAGPSHRKPWQLRLPLTCRLTNHCPACRRGGVRHLLPELPCLCQWLSLILFQGGVHCLLRGQPTGLHLVRAIRSCWAFKNYIAAVRSLCGHTQGGAGGQAAASQPSRLMQPPFLAPLADAAVPCITLPGAVHACAVPSSWH